MSLPVRTPKPVRVGLLTGSAVPYKVPIYRLLSHDPRLDFTAIFASSGGIRPFNDGYGREITWDVDLLGGYRSRFLRRADVNPVLGSSFWSVRDPDVVSEVRRGDYDVLWLGGYHSATYLLAAATQLARGRQVLFAEEQTLLHPRSLGTTLVKEVALRLLFRQNWALYISTENRRWFEHYGMPASRLFSSPYTVDAEALDCSNGRRLDERQDIVRRELGITANGGPVILTVARLISKKQPLFLLEAFRRIRATRQCTLLVCGSGTLESAMREKVVTEGIPDVIFTGFLNQSQVARAYLAADIFALLSLEHETFGVVVAEAMHFGLPVVVSDKVGCAPDLVSNDFNGYVVGAQDVEHAAHALGRLVDDPGARKRMGAASRDRISGWTPERTARGIIDAVAAAVGPDRWSLTTRSATDP